MQHSFSTASTAEVQKEQARLAIFETNNTERCACGRERSANLKEVNAFQFKVKKMEKKEEGKNNEAQPERN